jgi:hypothetical protein
VVVASVHVRHADGGVVRGEKAIQERDKRLAPHQANAAHIAQAVRALANALPRRQQSPSRRCGGGADHGNGDGDRDDAEGGALFGLGDDPVLLAIGDFNGPPRRRLSMAQTALPSPSSSPLCPLLSAANGVVDDSDWDDGTVAGVAVLPACPPPCVTQFTCRRRRPETGAAHVECAITSDGDEAIDSAVAFACQERAAGLLLGGELTCEVIDQWHYSPLL